MSFSGRLKELAELYQQSAWRMVEVKEGINQGVIGVLVEPHVNKTHGEVSCRIMGIHPRLQNIYLESWNKTLVDIRAMEDVEVKEMIPKLTDEVMAFVSLYGCTIGADPEIFVVDENNILIPAFEFLPDKKTGNPFWDGFQAEFTLESGRTCLAYMVDDIRKMLMRILNEARRKYPRAKLTTQTVFEIPPDKLLKYNPEYTQLGCAPSLNIYGERTVCDQDPATIPFRSAGAHVHLGIRNFVTDNAPKIVRAMDLLGGLVSVSLLDGLEDPIRRRYYGRAGEYRLPAWGIEYRVPSSAMLCHPAVYHLMFDLIRASVYLGMQGFEPFFAVDDDVEYLINRYQVKKIRKLLMRVKDSYAVLLKRIYGDKGKVAWELIMKGAKNCIPSIDDMLKNWMLDIGDAWHGHSDSTNACIARIEVDEKNRIVGSAVGEGDKDEDRDDDDYDDEDDYDDND